METLAKGVAQLNAVDKKLRFLRRIPRDPMTGSTEWGLRSSQDSPDSSSYGGQNVYDIYSKSTGKALDGTKYTEW
jgi:general secretion pathway protein G